MGNEIENKVAIVGVGVSRQGELPELDAYGIAAEAFKSALDDAGLKKENIDGISIRALDPIQGQWQEAARTLGMDPRFGFTAMAGGASTTIAVQEAAMAIYHGLADTVAVLYACNNRTARQRFGAPRYEHHAPYGHFSPAARLALAFHRYMHDFYGSNKADDESVNLCQRKLGAISSAMRRHASLNPISYHKKPMSVDEYMEQRYICWPLRRPDYCLISDGGGCLILTSADRATSMKKPPVFVVGMGQGHVLRAQETPEYIYQRQMEGTCAETLYGNTGLDPKDIDAMFVYDSFSMLTLFAIENFGFCKPGEGLEFIQDGRIEYDGDFPVNTNGGHLAESYIGGILHYVEAVRQIRGEAGPRQIKKKLETVLACGQGTGGTNCGALILRKG